MNALIGMLAAFVALTSAQSQEVSRKIVIQNFEKGVSEVRAASGSVKLSVNRDPTLRDERVLLAEYPERSSNPAARDVWINAESQDWSKGRAIVFLAKPDGAIRLSVSFLDRNGVAYTSWASLKGGEWQSVRISFDEIRPNPYFQPPGAKTGAPIDVSKVTQIGFAPQDQSAGRVTIGALSLVE